MSDDVKVIQRSMTPSIIKKRWVREDFYIPDETIFDEEVRELIAKKVRSIENIELHTTQVFNCGRRIAYQFSGFPHLPDHWYSMKGWLGHEALEDYIVSGERPDVSFDAILDSDLGHNMNVDERIAVALSESLTPMIKNFHDWLETTDVDLSPANVYGKEVSLKRRITPRFSHVGTVDILCLDTILDPKMGRKVYKSEYYAQLGSYERLAKKAGIGLPQKRLLNLFLGGDKAEQLEPKRKSIQSALMKWDSALLTTMGNYGLLEKAELPSCKVGFGCTLCRWRHLCRGV